MTDIQHYALLILLVAAVGLVAVLSNWLTQRVKIPSPALVLVGGAVAVKVVPTLHAPEQHAVERIVTVALACILFDGGMHIGWSRFRSSAGPIVMTGVLGTFATVTAAAVLGHYALGLPWYVALLAATAVAPTDPAMVFSVLGQREVAGRSGAILEGESGANDPVGIALMTAVIAAGGLSWGAFAKVGGNFLLQMGVGAVVGAAGGAALLWFIRRIPLPSEGLYPLRTLAGALLLYGLATLADGSGFLAVFIAGIVLGDQRAPFKREVERFHSALASLAEIVAFAVLGLTIDLGVLARADVWVPGVAGGAMVAFVIRPVLVGLCLWPSRLEHRERAFVLFAGLKGAVPILLGSYLLAAGVPDAERLYGIVAVVVIFSVFVQASLVPAAARLLRVRMRRIEPQPWALGVRLQDEPTGVHRLTIKAGSPADGRTVRELTGLPGEAWVSFVVRDGQLVPITDDAVLRPGDEVLVLADPSLHGELVAAFEKPALLSGGQRVAGLEQRLRDARPAVADDLDCPGRVVVDDGRRPGSKSSWMTAVGPARLLGQPGPVASARPVVSARPARWCRRGLWCVGAWWCAQPGNFRGFPGNFRGISGLRGGSGAPCSCRAITRVRQAARAAQLVLRVHGLFLDEHMIPLFLPGARIFPDICQPCRTRERMRCEWCLRDRCDLSRLAHAAIRP